MSGTTQIFTEVDYERDGKQVGYLHLPYSVTRSAYGTIAMPVAVVKRGRGPTVLLMSGNHGDEYEGQVVLSRLIRELGPADVAGRVILLPAANYPAAMAGTRVSPLDEGNLNRMFPGDPSGRPTQQIAHYIDSVLAPMCQYWMDLHSGGSSLDYVPFAGIHLSNDPALDAKAVAALRAFAPELGFVWAYSHGQGMASWAALRRGIVHMSGEFGGAGTVNPDGVKRVYDGVLRCLQHFGVLAPDGKLRPPAATVKTRLMQLSGLDYYVFAPEAGLFEPYVRLGEWVKKGQAYGAVHFVDNPAREPVLASFKHDGMLICKRHPGRCERGDCLAHLGTDFVPPGG
ncbi:MAG: hypothetical protein FJX68_12260 [Alphaproteobacteria bacterium]|nr:hypothetical protein [Alphaproteobacteria bacterium]